jgi:hypothetical protein
MKTDLLNSPTDGHKICTGNAMAAMPGANTNMPVNPAALTIPQYTPKNTPPKSACSCRTQPGVNAAMGPALPPANKNLLPVGAGGANLAYNNRRLPMPSQAVKLN